MLRYTRALAAVILAVVGAIGCSQCDTCDDFPIPCNGGNCGFEGPAPPGAYNVVPGGPGTTFVAPEGFVPPPPVGVPTGAPAIAPPPPAAVNSAPAISPPPPPAVNSTPAISP